MVCRAWYYPSVSASPQPNPEGFDPVEKAARALRENPTATIIVGFILLVIVVVLERVRTREFEELLDNAPIDDEPLDAEDLAAIAEPIVASELVF